MLIDSDINDKLQIGINKCPHGIPRMERMYILFAPQNGVDNMTIASDVTVILFVVFSPRSLTVVVGRSISASTPRSGGKRDKPVDAEIKTSRLRH